MHICNVEGPDSVLAIPLLTPPPPPSVQVTYRVIQVSDGQVDGQTDGASAVSVVTGFPATTQTVTQVQPLDGVETHKIHKFALSHIYHPLWLECIS